MISPTERLAAIRSLRAHVENLYPLVAEPNHLPGRVTGDMVIKMMYQHANREQHAQKFQAILADLDEQERDILSKLATEEVSA